MLCDRCGRPVQGKPEVIHIETGTGVVTITVCSPPCQSPLDRRSARSRPRSY